MIGLLCVLGYLIIGTALMVFVWANGGEDLTVRDALLILFLAVFWPVVLIVAAFKWAGENDVMNFVIWKRK